MGGNHAYGVVGRVLADRSAMAQRERPSNTKQRAGGQRLRAHRDFASAHVIVVQLGRQRFLGSTQLNPLYPWRPQGGRRCAQTPC